MGLGKFADLRGSLAKNTGGGGCFWRGGWYPNAQYGCKRPAVTPPNMPWSVQVCTNRIPDFLLGKLQHMTCICYPTESVTCLKFHSYKPKHFSFKKILVANLILFCFHLFTSCFKTTSFLFKIFVANSSSFIFICFDFLLENWSF